MNIKIKNLILITVILIGFLQAAFVIDWGLISILSGPLSYVLLIVFFTIFSKLKVKSDFEYHKLVICYLVLGIIEIVRGLFDAQNYWDWKFMIFDTALVMLIPIAGFMGSDKNLTQAVYYNYMKYLLPVSILVLIAARHSDNTDGFARFLSPLYFVILFIPVLTNKWKVIIIIFITLSFFSDLGSRSNLIRIIAALGIMSFYYFRVFIKKNFIEFLRIVFIITPFILFILGVTDIFNIFKIGENTNGKFVNHQQLAGGEIREDDITEDSRTFIYDEVLQSGIYRDTWLFGEGACAGYISEWFDRNFIEEDLGSKGRARSEVCILNVFNVYGIFGVIAFTLIFYFASYLCVNRSNSYICKLIGLFIAFRFTYSWIEEFFDFSMNLIFIWLFLGLCFSKSFRKMNDKELQEWIHGMFDKKLIGNQDYI